MNLARLPLDVVVGFWADLFGVDDTIAWDHLRNRSGLEAALDRPAHYAYYEQVNLPRQAAILAHGIAEGQYFIDGNKRVAFVAMMTALEYTGYTVSASDAELADWIMDLAGNSDGEAALSRHLEQSLEAVSFRSDEDRE